MHPRPLPLLLVIATSLVVGCGTTGDPTASDVSIRFAAAEVTDIRFDRIAIAARFELRNDGNGSRRLDDIEVFVRHEDRIAADEPLESPTVLDASSSRELLAAIEVPTERLPRAGEDEIEVVVLLRARVDGAWVSGEGRISIPALLPPRVILTGVRRIEVSPLAAALELDVRIENPNASPLSLGRLELRPSLDRIDLEPVIVENVDQMVFEDVPILLSIPSSTRLTSGRRPELYELLRDPGPHDFRLGGVLRCNLDSPPGPLDVGIASDLRVTLN